MPQTLVRPRRAAAALATLVLLPLWLAVCSGGDGGPSSPPGDDDDGARVVTVSGTTFSPATITVAPGTKVRWVVDGGTHTVTPNTPGQPGAWTGTGLLSAGQTFEHTFTVSGQSYDYHCQPHQSLGMTGRVTVQ